MINSKRNQYLLLTLVAFIWGIVIYRLVSFTDSEGDGMISIPITEFNKSTTVPENIYIYNLNYRDPFLKESRSQNSKPTPVQNARQPLRTGKILPDIKLIGVVTSDNRTTGILQIRNKSHIVSEGDEINQFKVISIQKDRLFIYYTPFDSSFYLTR